MEDSILISTKKILGVGEDEDVFDLDIITHINSTFSTVTQLGVGPSTGFFIVDDSGDWSDLDLPVDQLGFLRSYIFLNVKMLFDPPATSFHIAAIEKQIEEHLVRLSYLREYALVPSEPTPTPTPGDDIDYANGVQSTPSLVWIMTHNLGYNPAAFRFFDVDEETELEPESVTYVNSDVALATWPEAIAGSWMAS